MIIELLSTTAILGIIAFLGTKLHERQKAFEVEREEMPEEVLSDFDKVVIGEEKEADFRLVDMGVDDKMRPFIVKMSPEQEWWYNQKDRKAKRKVKMLCLQGKDPFPELKQLDRQAKKDKRMYDAMDKVVVDAGLKG